ncbi:MAG: sugar phosphate isomerase/epimerase [Alphaproteobacteria bacterium]|nr:MAG: sugar phosphate isomerase/epimerase [Alphaproteobacteria bacterium]
MAEPLVIGASLTVDGLGRWRDWLWEVDRDLELQSFHAAAVLDGDWRPLADRARALLAGYRGRIGIHGPFLGFTIHSADPAVRAVAARRIDQGLDVCAHLGATQMVIHSPYTTWDSENLDNYPATRARVIEAVHATLGRAVQRAGTLGVEIVIENISDSQPMDRLILAESFGAAAVAVSLDTGHAHWAHRRLGAPAVDRHVQMVARRLRHVHLQDSDGAADRHWCPGEGSVPWAAVLRALVALPHRPRLVMELRDDAQLKAGLAHLAATGLAR